MMRRCSEADIAMIESIINDAAQAYREVIPPDRWHEPYMPRAALEAEIARHAYVRSNQQRLGIGSALMNGLIAQARRRLLVGTWAAAHWAIRFYEGHGFRRVSTQEKDQLLTTYWTIPARQRETSVVLVHASEP